VQDAGGKPWTVACRHRPRMFLPSMGSNVPFYGGRARSNGPAESLYRHLSRSKRYKPMKRSIGLRSLEAPATPSVLQLIAVKFLCSGSNPNAGKD
jgi:hypothetical protein